MDVIIYVNKLSLKKLKNNDLLHSKIDYFKQMEVILSTYWDEYFLRIISIFLGILILLLMMQNYEQLKLILKNMEKEYITKNKENEEYINTKNKEIEEYINTKNKEIEEYINTKNKEIEELKTYVINKIISQNDEIVIIKKLAILPIEKISLSLQKLDDQFYKEINYINEKIICDTNGLLISIEAVEKEIKDIIMDLKNKNSLL